MFFEAVLPRLLFKRRYYLAQLADFPRVPAQKEYVEVLIVEGDFADKTVKRGIQGSSFTGEQAIDR